MAQDAVDLLLKSDLLGGVPEDTLRALDPPPQMSTLSAGETLIRQGEPGSSFYLLVHGRLRVFVQDAKGVTRRVGEVQPGEGVGEMSLLTGDLTSATVRAMHDCNLVQFSRQSYLQLMERSPEAALQITRTVIRRLRAGLSGSRKTSFSTIAILPLDPGIDARQFADLLEGELNRYTPVTVITPDSLDPQQAHLVGQRERLSPIEDHAVTSKLLEREREPGVVVYLADYEAVEWTRICVRQADAVLLLASVDSSTGLSGAEKALLNYLDKDLAPRTDLVLLHPPEWRAHCGAARWMAPRGVSEVHHLRRWREEDFTRLARILTGNAINLVLGGGGARGFAQIGVLKALLEGGIPIDRIGGTSMGSLIGALYALGYGYEKIVQMCREIWIEGKPLRDYTFPSLSIVRGRRLHNLIKNALVGWDVEDLPVTFYCVSGNLTSTDLVFHNTGPLWEGVRASGSIPGAGPPMFLNGNILVDGGVLNNLPGDIMLNRYGGHMIIVDVSPDEPMTVPTDIEETPSGWHILWSRFSPFAKPIAVPNMFELLYRTATLSSSRLSKVTYQLADFLLVPPVGRFGTLSFEALDEIAGVGYRDTVRRLHELKDSFINRYLQTDKLPQPEDVIEPAWDSPAEKKGRRSPLKLAAMAAAAAVLVVLGGRAYMSGHIRPAAGTVGQGPGIQLSTVTERNGTYVLPVTTVLAREMEGYEVREKYAGRVVTRRSSKLGFERSGLLVQILADEGARVKAGDVLARLDESALSARRRELRAELSLRRALREQNLARLELARLSTRRNKQLLGGHNISQQTYDQAYFAEKAMESEMAASAAAVEQVTAALETLENEIRKSKITAPFDGTIVERLVDEGVAVNPGAPILRLIEDGVKEVRVGVPQNATKNLRVGDSYEMEIDGLMIRGRLKTFLDTVDQQTRTVVAIFEIADVDRRLRSGQLAQLNLKYTVQMKGYWLPTTALIGGRRGLWNAYVVEAVDGEKEIGRLSLRELQLLHSEADRVYVRGTMRDAERVVASGLQRLVPNQMVSVAPSRNGRR